MALSGGTEELSQPQLIRVVSSQAAIAEASLALVIPFSKSFDVSHRVLSEEDLAVLSLAKNLCERLQDVVEPREEKTGSI